MWFFMYACYILTALTFFSLGIAFFQSFLKFPVFHADHVTFMIFTSILYSFTETLVIFFFVGTGVSVKEYTRDHKLNPDFHKRSIGIKRKVYPPLMLNLLFMIILFVLVGAVDTYRFPGWLYYILFFGCIAHYIKIKIVQNACFQQNTQIILDMSGINRTVV
ncbi:MAG: hypothetical protein KBD53_00135 [Candidatus Omnitrophica bacterium]|nr:hypothetical protein [Candidatus Omnitrophota bacterium]